MSPNVTPPSPTMSWFQSDSRTATARITSSFMPHFQAVHWMISSVLPTKLPVTRDV